MKTRDQVEIVVRISHALRQVFVYESGNGAAALDHEPLAMTPAEAMKLASLLMTAAGQIQMGKPTGRRKE